MAVKNLWEMSILLLFCYIYFQSRGV